MKGSQKPKKLGKKPAQKTLKERRTAKRAAAKHASRGLDDRLSRQNRACGEPLRRITTTTGVLHANRGRRRVLAVGEERDEADGAGL